MRTDNVQPSQMGCAVPWGRINGLPLSSRFHPPLIRRTLGDCEVGGFLLCLGKLGAEGVDLFNRARRANFMRWVWTISRRRSLRQPRSYGR